MKTLQVCSLFAGIGGIDLAFCQAGFQIVYANEYDKDACSTYLQNFPKTNLVQGDIRQINEDSIPEFDVLVAGFPCQSFSVCGYQRGFEDERGNLFFEICRILDAKRPMVVFLENVANLVKHDNGKTFSVIKQSLLELGYTVKYTVMDAIEYGVPQHRTRTYIVAFKNAAIAQQFSFPEKQQLTRHIFDIIDKNVPVDVSWYLDESSRKYQKMNAAIDDDNQIYRFSDYGIQKGKNGISFTLKANMGVWYDREPIIRDTKGIRKLTPKECLLLQGFSDDFRFPDIPEKSAYKQAGNTVCVPVVREIAEKIKECMTFDEELVLVGVVRNKKQLSISMEKKFYHFPMSKMPAEGEKANYVVIRLPKYLSETSDVEYIGKIKERVIVPRSAISDIPKNSEELYCLITVDSWETIPKSLDLADNIAVFVIPISKIDI